VGTINVKNITKPKKNQRDFVWGGIVDRTKVLGRTVVTHWEQNRPLGHGV
jgi:hypothetical protein